MTATIAALGITVKRPAFKPAKQDRYTLSQFMQQSFVFSFVQDWHDFYGSGVVAAAWWPPPSYLIDGDRARGWA
jgi:hypothetical protein